MQNLDLWTDEDLSLLLQLKKAVDAANPVIFQRINEETIWWLAFRPENICSSFALMILSMWIKLQ